MPDWWIKAQNEKETKGTRYGVKCEAWGRNIGGRGLMDGIVGKMGAHQDGTQGKERRA